jgi:5'-phosphate synthase pdxT subunit
VTVQRNAFGRQVDSFEANLNIRGVDGDKLFHAIFIRAPLIESVGAGVDVLARVEKDDREVIVAAQQGNLLVTSFHPELSNDDRFHRYFVKMAECKT